MEDFRQIRENLIELLEDLDDRLSNITDINAVDAKPLKSVTIQTTKKNEFIDDFGNTSYKEIEQIKQAISRIDQGTYDICLICGKAIKKERLDTIPFSNHCMHCAIKKYDN